MAIEPTAAELFDKLFSQTAAAANGCVEFTGADNGGGYGHLWTGKKNIRAHRLAWTLLRGPIPEGQVVRHLVCNNRRCINVWHLALGTVADNNADTIRAGRAVHVKGHGFLTIAEVQEIRRLLKGGRLSQTEIGRRFGVSDTAVRAIKLKRSFAWLPEEEERESAIPFRRRWHLNRPAVPFINRRHLTSPSFIRRRGL
jgi:hypothetical protein